MDMHVQYESRVGCSVQAPESPARVAPPSDKKAPAVQAPAETSEGRDVSQLATDGCVQQSLQESVEVAVQDDSVGSSMEEQTATGLILQDVASAAADPKPAHEVQAEVNSASVAGGQAVDLGLTGQWLKRQQAQKAAGTSHGTQEMTPLQSTAVVLGPAVTDASEVSEPGPESKASDPQEKPVKKVKDILAASAARMRAEGSLKPPTQEVSMQKMPRSPEQERAVDKSPDGYVDVARPAAWDQVEADLDPASQRGLGAGEKKKKKSRKGKKKKKTCKRKATNPPDSDDNHGKTCRKKGKNRKQKGKKHHQKSSKREICRKSKPVRDAASKPRDPKSKPAPKKPKQVGIMKKPAAKASPAKAAPKVATARKPKGQPLEDPIKEEIRLRNGRKSKAYHAALADAKRQNMDMETAKEMARAVSWLKMRICTLFENIYVSHWSTVYLSMCTLTHVLMQCI